MKLVQDPQSGQILIKLKHNESCDHDPEELFQALLEFTSEQAVIIYDLNKRVTELEEYIKEQKDYDYQRR
jgi:hypothetical protein